MEWYPLKGDGSALRGSGFFGDARLDAQLAALSGVRWRAEGGVRELAIPWEPGEPFPLTELFCFARPESVEGRSCVVYRIDAQGMPL